MLLCWKVLPPTLTHYAQVPETSSIKAVLVDEEAVGSVDTVGCGAKVLCDVDELERYANGGIVRDLKVFSPDVHFFFLVNLLPQFKIGGLCCLMHLPRRTGKWFVSRGRGSVLGWSRGSINNYEIVDAF